MSAGVAIFHQNISPYYALIWNAGVRAKVAFSEAILDNFQWTVIHVGLIIRQVPLILLAGSLLILITWKVTKYLTARNNNNENQTGTLSFAKRRNFDEQRQISTTKSLLQSAATRPSSQPSYQHYKGAACSTINCNLFVDLATDLLESLPKLFTKTQPVLPPSFPQLETSVEKNVEGEYEELWIRSPGDRCSERTLVYMVPGTAAQLVMNSRSHKCLQSSSRLLFQLSYSAF